MSDPVVTVRRSPLGCWLVFIDGNVISDHTTHRAARTAAQQLINATKATP